MIKMKEMKIYKRREGFYTKTSDNYRIRVNENMFKKYDTNSIFVVIEKRYGCKAVIR